MLIWLSGFTRILRRKHYLIQSHVTQCFWNEDSIYPTSVSHLLTSDKVAIKVLDKTRLNVQTQKLLSREISCMEALQHANIVRLYEVVESHSRLYLVLEYAGGGDLHTHICSEGRLSEPVAKITFAQILSAIKHMHAKNIIHRDLKAENVLYACNGCVKVADFGFSTMVTNSSDTLDTFCGSPSYAAPELFRDECYLGPPVDVWAMGVLLFFMVTGTMPFRADTMGKLRRAVIEGVFTLPPWVPGPCQRLIRGVLKPVPAERYAVDQMVGCDWLLPVDYPWTVSPVPLNPLRLADAEPGELSDEEEEIKALLQELGVTMEHIRNNQGKGIRSPISGLYSILLHRAQKGRGAETVPVVRGLVRDHKREGLRAYKGLIHSSKLCALQ
uniref:non-specific serine/threonine protein kinase n=1 Tax=Esox lucius TaxID=8010 RepID=A0A6Q2YTB6_ESOLU